MDIEELNNWWADNLGYQGGLSTKQTFEKDDCSLIFVTDPPADRMRVFVPIGPLEKFDLKRMLIANFHETLDVEYSVYNNVVCALYKNWLSELTERSLKEAIDQVINLTKNTLIYDKYSSGKLSFGGGGVKL